MLSLGCADFLERAGLFDFIYPPLGLYVAYEVLTMVVNSPKLFRMAVFHYDSDGCGLKTSVSAL